MRRFTSLLTLFTFGLAGLVAWSAEPAPGPRPVAVRDPLPQGALARLGSTRFAGTRAASYPTALDGDRILFTGQHGAWAVVDLATGQIRQEHAPAPGNRPNVDAPSVLRGDRVIGHDGTALFVWDVRTGRVVHRWEREPFVKGRYLDGGVVSASADGSVFTFYSRGTLDAQFRHDQTESRGWVFTVGERLTAREFRAACDPGWEPGAVVTPDGKTLVTSAPLTDPANKDVVWDIRVWDVNTMKLRHWADSGRELAGPGAFSADGRRVVWVDRSNQGQVWDLGTGKRVADLAVYHHPEARSGRWRFSADGKTLACLYEGGAVQTWDAGTGKLGAQYAPPPLAVPIWWAAPPAIDLGNGPGGRLVAFGGNSRAVAWDVKRAAWMTPASGQAGMPWMIKFTPDGTRLRMLFNDIPHVWNLDDGGRASVQPLDLPEGPPRNWRADRFSPCGRYVGAKGTYERRWLGAFDLDRGGSARWEVGPGAVGRLPKEGWFEWSPTGNVVAVNGRYPDPRPPQEPGHLLLLDARTGCPVESPRVPVWGGASCRFSPDGRRLVVWHYDDPRNRNLRVPLPPRVEVWDVRTGQRLSESRVPSPDERLGKSGWEPIAVLADNRTVLMSRVLRTGGEVLTWNLETGAFGETRPVPGGWVTPSPDGTRLAVVDSDFAEPTTVVQVLTWPGLKPAGSLVGHRASIRALEFSPDGKRLATSSRDHTVLLWRVP